MKNAYILRVVPLELDYILGASAVSVEGIGIKGQPRALSEDDVPSLAERAKIV